MRAYIYARCSTDKQDLSIEDQVKAAETYVAKTGGAVVDVLQDEAVSGAEMDRPGLKALLEACERGNGAATHVLVWDSSRLGRPKDRLDGMHIIRRIQNAGKKLVYVSTGQEVDDSLGSDILGVVQFEANADYIRRASLASFRGVKARVDLCFDPGRTVPYGFDKAIIAADRKTLVVTVRNLPSREKEVRTAEGELQRVLPAGDPYTKQESEFATLVTGTPERVDVVREIFRRAAAGEGTFKIRDALNARGIPGPRGQAWSLGTVQSILTNEVYVGKLVYNRRTHSKFFKHTKDGVEARLKSDEKMEMRPDEDLIVRENAFPALVDKATFEAVQRRLSRRRALPPRLGRAARSVYLLSGKLRCGCGHRLFGQQVVSQKGYRSRYYVCGGYHNRGEKVVGHKRYSVPLDWLEQVVLDTLAAEFEALPEECPELEEAIAEELKAQEKQGGADERESLRRQKVKLDKEIANLSQNLTKLDPATAESLGLFARAKELAARKAEVEKMLASAPQSPQMTDIKRLAKELAQKRHDFRALLKKADRAMLRELLDDYVVGGVVNENRREVVLDLVPPVFSRVVAGVGFEPTTYGL